MRYWAEPKYRKYVKWYGFLPFFRKCDDKYGKKLKYNAKKAAIDATKTASKRVAQKNEKQHEIWLEIK